MRFLWSTHVHAYFVSFSTALPDITVVTTQCMSASHSSAGIVNASPILMAIIHVDLSVYGALTPNLRLNITS